VRMRWENKTWVTLKMRGTEAQTPKSKGRMRVLKTRMGSLN